MKIGRFFFTMLSAKRWYRSRKFQVVAVTIGVMCALYYLALVNKLNNPVDLDITRRKSVIEYIENKLQEALKEDKGTGCEMPKLDPFAKEVTQFDKELAKVVCNGQDWVKCYLSECKVTEEILKTTKDIVCTYRDIIYESDIKYHIGPPIEVPGDNVYTLTASDHVKIKCTGKHIDSVLPSKWLGHGVGFRNTVKPKKPPPGREDSVNVLILGFDSTSRNGFIRRMPKSYKVLTEELKATVLLGYNIVGDGTPAALFPILTGKTELELPDVRRRSGNTATLDSMPFIFYTLKEDGYRTAYFEDMPWIGTFQYRFNGFRRQPADHYLRSFYLEESNRGRRWDRPEGRYCIGDTPQYRLMLNITQQFLKLNGKRFIFTFIADITHDDFNMIATADDDLADFLMAFQHSGLREDTMLLLMGDHGPRYAKVRETLQGKLEERLPLMAVALPKTLAVYRETLERNSHLLTTPHDIHATLLHALRLRHLQPEYSVRGADYPRAMSLFEPLPTNRSCSEAGVEPHWCACVRWQQLDPSDAFYTRAVEAFVSHLNQLTEPVRDRCVERSLLRVSWVMRQQANKPLLQFAEARDEDGYVGKFTARTDYNVNYQIKVEVGPGRGVYEASMTYSNREDKFYIDNRDISRTNAYGNEPSCISGTHRHLNMFCFCKGTTPHVED